MPLTGTTNTAANTALRYLNANSAQAGSSLAKLSSGSRIVKASDDAASLAVGTKIRADVSALRQAAVNTAQASSLLQVADGGLAKIADILLRMKSLAVQAQSGSITDSERNFLDLEYQELISEVGDISGQTKFNGAQLLNGASGKSIDLSAATDSLFNPDSTHANGIAARLSGNAAVGTWQLAYDYTAGSSLGQFTLSNGTISDTVQFTHASNAVVHEGRISFEHAGLELALSNFDFSTTFAAGTQSQLEVAGGETLSFQVGVASGDTITINIDDVRPASLGLTGTSVGTTGSSVTAGDALDAAISELNAARANMGAMMSRFEFAAANLATSVENLDAARSTLLDVDMAAEMTRFTSLQILTQAGVSMLAQANQMPQNLLRLLQ
ncbi:flagellin N-terminal helical domain-containing protein [Geminicoccus roseus]|uniref:flagellin N-terminal helical domain-containing protein n=1 Tax=Geminicoccus roseus TaxID=404900 RepID=UPI000410910F|nr:flagellin [Geminicoccus roseus]